MTEPAAGMLPTPHGFGDDERARLLRQRPEAAALRWLESELGGRVGRVQALKGGSSSAIHAVTLERPAERTTVVLRRYVIDALHDEEPDIAEREARVLPLLERTDLPAPQLLAVDESGHQAGCPTVVMSRLPGRLDWSPADIDPWLRKLAELLPCIHAAPITVADGVQPFTPYRPERWEMPAWLGDPTLWDRALAAFHGPRLDDDAVFVHRDFHPGNVLWKRGAVTGLVDWQAASIGPRAVDVWHCRGNLLSRFGRAVADRFLRSWEIVSGEPYNPWAEAVMLVDKIGWGQPRRRGEQEELRALLRERLAELGY